MTGTYLATSNFIFPVPLTFAVEVLVFLALLWLLRAYVYPPLDAVLRERQRRIKSTIEEADQIRLEVEEARRSLDARMDEARRQSEAMVARAEELGEKLKEEMRLQAHAEADGLLERARRDIEVERQKVVDGLRREMAELVVRATGRVLGEELDAARHAKLIQEALDKVDLSA